METEWTYTAESYLDQLPAAEQSKVLHAVQGLPAAWDNLGESRLSRLAGDQNDLYSLRVGADLLVLVKRADDHITVVDVVRRSQVEGLRRVAALRQSAPG